MMTSLPNLNPPSTRKRTRLAKAREDKRRVRVAQAHFPGQAGILDRGERRCAGAAVKSGNRDDIRARLRNTRSDNSNARTGNKFHSNSRAGLMARKS